MTDPPEPARPRDDEATLGQTQEEPAAQPAAGGEGGARLAPGQAAADDLEDDPVRRLVKRALGSDAVARSAPDILRGVQRRLRQRSRGKFFADGWSTTQARQAYIMVALITLLLVAVAYYALSPVDFR